MTASNGCSTGEKEEKQSLNMLILKAFSAVGRAVINWVDTLGSATVFLFFCPVENISAQTIIKSN